MRGDPRGGELWLAADSRLTGDGNIWDDCPKLFVLPRRDAVAAFSGSTAQAYPLINQFANAINAYRASASGAVELFDLLGHLERVADSMLARLVPDPGVASAAGRREFASRGDVIIVGGFSREAHGLVLRALKYEANPDGWRFTRVRPSPSLGRARILRMFGDNASRSRYHYRLRQLLSTRGALGSSAPFDLEPLEALVEFLKLPASRLRPLPQTKRPLTIGGSPQVVRVAAGADATPFVVRWTDPPHAELSGDYLFGRRCFSYERLDLPLITLEQNGLQIHAPGQWTPERLEEHPPPSR